MQNRRKLFVTAVLYFTEIYFLQFFYSKRIVIRHYGYFAYGYFVSRTGNNRFVGKFLLVISRLRAPYDVDVFADCQIAGKTRVTSPNYARDIVALVILTVYGNE